MGPQSLPKIHRQICFCRFSSRVSILIGVCPCLHRFFSNSPRNLHHKNAVMPRIILMSKTSNIADMILKDFFISFSLSQLKSPDLKFNERDVKREKEKERNMNNRCVGAAALATRNEKSRSTLHAKREKEEKPERNVSCLRTIECCVVQFGVYKFCFFFSSVFG